MKQRIANIHSRFSIKTKLTVAFLLVGLLTILIMGYLSYTYYTIGIKRDFYRISQEATIRLNHHIEFYIYQLAKSTSSVAKDELIQKWLQGEQALSLEQIADVQNLLRKHVALNYSEIVGIFLLTPDGRKLAMSTLASTSMDLFNDEPWFNNGFPEKISVLSTHTVKYYPGDVRVLSLELPIYSIANMDFLGKMVIDFHLDEIQRTFEKTNLAPKGQFFIVSDQDSIVYHREYKWLGVARNETELGKLDLSDNESASIQQWDGKKTLVAVTKSAEIGWNFVSIVPFDEMASATKNTPNAMLIAFMIIAVCIISTVPFLSGAFMKPIVHLRQVMGSVERGDLTVRASYISGQDEFQYLNRSFNNMIDRINDLLETVSTLKLKEVSLQLREKEALVKALRNQINPHFLYNSLDIIKSMAYLEDMPEIVKMARSLADFYRYTAQDTNGIVKLEEELSQLKDYLSIIHIRFPGTFRSKFSVNEKFMNCLIPKLIIQPIVENAVKYAIEPKEGQGTIIINAFDDRSDLVIEIADNGPGIENNRLIEIEKSLSQFNEGSHFVNGIQQSLGIANVHARIVLMHGTDYGLRLDSFEGRGTVVSIRLPLNFIK
ncbi:sensor histidine kinase [Paenibacillus radicis (ex Xue et al. 2023)]|uniref:histidine kinase n=1 Tax=Paenibacillus radicis (ex Xue et al. 2023) TaxID=2972489 RepID=A0ABT1YG38_9BACL|nr:sensor histidine kinase [Paenibacillus radicis (ex Xue et al. 2023)]MCR8632156.1 histidine kinase [Paenibacillus radicis (ex Xue et al. 2023)]